MTPKTSIMATSVVLLLMEYEPRRQKRIMRGKRIE
jgi:hypothetical protein